MSRFFISELSQSSISTSHESSESLSAPDSEFGEECDSEPDSEVEDALLAPLKSRDSIFFSFS